MIYITSDIHGCLDSLKAVLKKAKFNEEKDKLYILGDIVDRGPFIWETYQWVKERLGKSVFMILGNHEDGFMTDVYIMKGLELKKNGKEPENEKEEKYIKLTQKYWGVSDHYGTISRLTDDGHTLDELLEMCDFFEALPLFYKITVNDKEWVLVHAYCWQDVERTPRDLMIWERCFAEEPETFCEGKNVIFGHTPTIFYWDKDIQMMKSEDGKSEKINVDCGCVYGNKQCLLRLDDMKVFYQKVLEDIV